MPIIPKFSLSQDANSVTIRINIPHIRINSLEIITETHNFTFYCKPYLLKLVLPCPLQGDDDKCKGLYDPNTENGVILVTLPKLNPGEHFPNLDLLTTLLHNTKSTINRINSTPKIEEVASNFRPQQAAVADASPNLLDECRSARVVPAINLESNFSSIDDNKEIDFDSGDDEICTHFEKMQLNEELKINQLISISPAYPYGFNNSYKHVITPIQELIADIIEVVDPDMTPPSLRRSQRLRRQLELFDPARYLGDLYGITDDPIYNLAKDFNPFYCLDYSKKIAKKKETKLRQSIKCQQDLSTADSKFDFNGKLSNLNQVTPLFPSDFAANKGDLGTALLDDSDAEQLKDNQESLFAEKEKNILTSLKNKSFSISKESPEQKSALYNLLDILFAVCYEERITQGEFSVESACNVTRLSSTLSWFDHYQATNLQTVCDIQSTELSRFKIIHQLNASELFAPQDSILTVLQDNLNRSLVYPYIRSWKFSTKIFTDVCKLLFLGKRYVLKCLLQLKDVFEHTHTFYILNKLYIDDYCVWIQSVPDDVIQRLALDYNSIVTSFIKEKSATLRNHPFKILELESWAEPINMGEDSELPEIPSYFYFQTGGVDETELGNLYIQNFDSTEIKSMASVNALNDGDEKLLKPTTLEDEVTSATSKITKGKVKLIEDISSSSS